MKQEFFKLVRCGTACILFTLVELIGLALLIRTPLLIQQKAFLFRLIILTALCCVLLLVVNSILYIKKIYWLGISFSASVLSLGIATLVVCLFCALGPMTIERSYTIFSLAGMADSPTSICSSDDIKNRFIYGYIEDAQESQKRIDEQVYIGNLIEISGGYQISEKGQSLVRIFRIIEKIFPVPDKNSIYPNGVKDD